MKETFDEMNMVSSAQEREDAIAAITAEKEQRLHRERENMQKKIAIAEAKLRQLPKECVDKAYPEARERKFNKKEFMETWEKLHDHSASAFLKRTLKLAGYRAAQDAYAVNLLSLKFYLEKQLTLR